MPPPARRLQARQPPCVSRRSSSSTRDPLGPMSSEAQKHFNDVVVDIASSNLILAIALPFVLKRVVDNACDDMKACALEAPYQGPEEHVSAAIKAENVEPRNVARLVEGLPDPLQNKVGTCGYKTTLQFLMGP